MVKVRVKRGDFGGAGAFVGEAAVGTATVETGPGNGGKASKSLSAGCELKGSGGGDGGTVKAGAELGADWAGCTEAD